MLISKSSELAVTQYVPFVLQIRWLSNCFNDNLAYNDIGISSMTLYNCAHAQSTGDIHIFFKTRSSQLST